jgi:ketosteroid isomerase-like protein
VTTPRAEVVRRAYGALNRHDLEAFLAHVHPEVYFESLVMETDAERFRGHAGVRDWWGQISSVLEDLRWEVQILAEEGDLVLIALCIGGRGLGSGVEVEQRMWQVGEVRGDLATWWRFFRTEEEARQAFARAREGADRPA